jgi:GNAT superfamily N-acetyltransferase
MPDIENPGIRKFEESDLELVKTLIDKTIDVCYCDDYCAEAISFFKQWHCKEKILKAASEGWIIVLEINGQIKATGTLIGDEIVRVFVDPAIQKQGLGKKIMLELEAKAVSLGIQSVRLDASIPAKVFYDSLGYTTLEETFLEVENGKRLDYWKMAKELRSIM